MKFLDDPQFQFLFRSRIEDAVRSGRDPVGAASFALKEWESTRPTIENDLLSKVTRVEIVRGAETRYRLHMVHGDTSGIVELNQNDITDGPKAFRRAYLVEFQDIITFPDGAWSNFFALVLRHEKLKVIEGREEMTEEMLAVEGFVERAQRWIPTFDLHQSLREDDYVWFEEDTGHLLVRSERVNRYLKGAGYKITLERFALLLRERGVVQQTSFQKKVPPKNEGDKSQNLHFWRLNAVALGITREDVAPLTPMSLPDDVQNESAEGAG